MFRHTVGRLILTLALVACSQGETAYTSQQPDIQTIDTGPEISVIDLVQIVETEAPERLDDFNQPCTSNIGCESGWCVEGPTGYVCTQTCLEECPFGFQCKSAAATGTDIIFLCVPHVQKLCEPCLDSAQCYEGDCIQIGDDILNYCTAPCGEGDSCPKGYECDLSGDASADKQCMPIVGTCSCTPATAGAKRTCTSVNEFGSCLGWSTCDAEKGWIDCTADTPAQELCDGLDNDCDGVIDNGLEAPPCEKQEGVCANSVKTCGGTKNWLNCGTGTLPDSYEPVELSCDGLDNDCDGSADMIDVDKDGHIAAACGGDDCDDLNPISYKGAVEFCGDGADNDCSGTAEDKDADNDGHIDVACGGDDCNDNSALAKPGLSEVCGDGLDNDCDGGIDNKDSDDDTFLDPACGGNDCNDSDAGINPLAKEQCDMVDNDCDGVVDKIDIDNDGHISLACGGDDCDDLNPLSYPGATEFCGDGADNDCSGTAEDKDVDNDGQIDVACGGTDCNDNSSLAKAGLEEVCGDGLDNDCDGSIDNKDVDNDSFLDPKCGGTDCNDKEKSVHPGAVEQCDGLDNDCNGTVDDKDLDGDGFIDVACPNGSDCDDDAISVNPGMDEVCGDDGQVDEDCSGKDGDKDVDQDGQTDANPLCDAGTDCDDYDSNVYKGAVEIYDTKDSDCDGTVDEGLIAKGAVIVTEIMANPASVGDGYGEWFEVTNVSEKTVNLASWVVTDENTPTTDKFVLPVSASVLVEPGQSAVLCRNADPLLNGGVICDFGYDDFILAQKGDEIILSLAGVEIDRVAYGGMGWKPTLAGVSLNFDPVKFDPATNDLGGSWCYSPKSPESSIPGGDTGTPGTQNLSCGPFAN